MIQAGIKKEKKNWLSGAELWPKWQVDALLIFVTLIWGGTFLIVQNSIRVTGTFSFLTMRFGIGALVLALLFHRRLRHVTKSELLTGGLMGLFLFGGYAFQTLGLQYTTTSKAGFITGMNVVIVPMLSIFLLRQWPTLSATVGVGLAAVGLALLSMGSSFNLEFGLGETLVLGGAVCFAFHIVLISCYAPGKDAYNLATVQIAVTAFLSAVFIPVWGEPLIMPPGEVWLAALFMGVVATAFTFAIMNRVQQFTSSTRAALIYALEPVFAGMFGYFANEVLTTPALIGCALIFGGMIAAEIKFKRGKSKAIAEPKEKEEELAVA